MSHLGSRPRQWYLPHVDLRALEGEWLSLPDLADRLGQRLRDVRALIREQSVVGCRVDGLEGYRVPGAFIRDGQLIDGLRGSIMQLRDSGMDDSQIVVWLLTPHPELGETPAAALAAGRKHAVRRAAIAD